MGKQPPNSMRLRRIGAIAQANRHIQQSLPSLARDGDLALFLEVLGRELFPLCQQGGLIEVECPSIQLARERLVPIGHLVTELILNSVKSGAGRIGQGGKLVDRHFKLEVDDGPASRTGSIRAEQRAGHGHSSGYGAEA